MRPRFFPSRHDRDQRRVYRAATVSFALLAAAMLWPLYAPLARVRPTVLGVPLGMAWLIGLMALSFGAALALFVWETRRGLIDASAPRARRDR